MPPFRPMPVCWLLLLALGVALTASPRAHAQPYSIGVYYYPGWSAENGGSFSASPWQSIQSFPEREPLLGWYHDGRVDVIERQLQWMHQFGITFVVFDWYWNSRRKAPEASIQAYLKAPSRQRVKYALLWANHFPQTDGAREWDRMVDYWLRHHLQNPDYLRIEDKPVVFVFSGDFMRDNAARAGTSAAALVAAAQVRARAAGLKGIYFVLSTPALEYWAKGFALTTGFSALSAYMYHEGYAGTPATATGPAHGFNELDASYRMQWRWMLEHSALPYIVPMASGWDRRPWGGTRDDPLHDQSMATPDEFEAHLRAARGVMDTFPQKTRRMGIICCWNEFGEGAYIEPTRRWGTAYLERVRKVFAAQP